MPVGFKCTHAPSMHTHPCTLTINQYHSEITEQSGLWNMANDLHSLETFMAGKEKSPHPFLAAAVSSRKQDTCWKFLVTLDSGQRHLSFLYFKVSI